MEIRLEDRLIRYEDLIPCKAAFIDAKTPDSHLKDNYSIIGGGVSESKHQKVNLTEKHGFCIGAAGQPPKITNSAHSHTTAEVFMVYKSEWKFYWNNNSDQEAILRPGDIISLPTNMFRGFENVGDEYGMIFSILGHDDAGGGVEWGPGVIEKAKGHGLVLLENGKLIDTTIGEIIPDGVKPMSPLTDEQLKSFDEYIVDQMMQYVGSIGKYTPSISKDFPVLTPDSITYYDIIGPLDNDKHNFQVKPGDHNGDEFNVYGMACKGQGQTGFYIRDEAEVMFVHEGNFEIEVSKEGETFSAKMKGGDIMSFPKGSTRNIKTHGEGFAYLIVGGDYPQPPQLTPKM